MSDLALLKLMPHETLRWFNAYTMFIPSFTALTSRQKVFPTAMSQEPLPGILLGR